MRPTRITPTMLWLLILVSFVAAVPPFSVVQTASDNLDIAYPKNPAFIQDQSFNLHFHVFNSSGFILKPNQATCIIHIYNASNNHLLERNMTGDSNGLEFVVNLNSTHSSRIGSYPYIVQCNTTNEGGFVSTTYEVTANGTYNIENSTAIPFMIYLFGTIAVLFWFGTMLEENDQWQQGIKLLLNLFGLALLIIGAGYLIANMQSMNVPQSNYTIMNTLYWVLLVVLLFLIILFLVIFIFKLIDYMRRLKEPEF